MERITHIRGSKKGQSSGGATEASDTLRSKAYARVLDAIGEGEIEGLVNGSKSIYLNETPLQNPDDTFNFDVTVDLRHGTQGQGHIEGFPSVENEIQVGVEAKKESPVIRTITNSNVDAVRVKVQIPQLSSQDKKTGDLNGSSVKIALELQSNGGSWSRVVEEEIQGKTMSRYERAYRIPLTGSAPWSVRLVRLSDDSKDSSVANKTYMSSITEIIDTKLSYPNTALVGIRVDASQFDSIPTRSYHMRLLRVQVPTNYDPVARTYTGPWDGTFKIAWTNNPAWCFYDLITSERYGLGQHVPPDTVDKWTLYSIGKYCDELVPDGKGGTEPRFALNVYIQTREEAYKLLNDIAGAFRGLLYWGGGSIITTQDAPGEASYLFSNANVIDGEFTYAGSSVKARHTVALVTWNDLKDMGRQKVEYVEDAAGVAQLGVISTEVAAFGCTSQAQAHRAGRWILLSELTETETVTFSTGLEGVAVAPGRIIKVRDNYRHGKRLGGRVVSATSSQLTLDSEVQGASGGTIFVVAADGTTHTSKVSGSGDRLTLQTPMPTPAVRGATWVLSLPGDAPPKDYRVVSVTEKEGGIYDITALEHNAGKYALVDDVTNLGSSGGDNPGTPGPIVNQPKPPEAPRDFKVSVVNYLDAGVQKYKLVASWASPSGADTSHWEVEQRHESSNPVLFQNVAYPTLEIPDAKTGYHTLRVRAVHPKGVRSGWTSSNPVYVGRKIEDETGVFASATAKSSFLAVVINWKLRDTAADLIKAVEIWGRLTVTPEGEPEPEPKLLGTTAMPGTQWVHTDLLPAVKYTYRLRAVDQRGNKSAFYPPEGMVSEASSNVADIIDHLDDSFRNSQFYRDLTSRIEDIDIPGLDEVRDLLDGVGDIADRVEAIRKGQERAGDLLLRSVVVDEEVKSEARDGIARALDAVSIVQDGLALEVSRRELLEVRVEDTQAFIAQEQVARADGDEALASSLNVLAAKVENDKVQNQALILQESEARANADGAIALTVNSLGARFNNFNGEAGKTVESVITDERTARANADLAMATSVSALVSRFDNVDPTGKASTSFEARIAREEQTRATADAANATSITQVSARMDNAGGTGVTLEQSFTATANKITGLSAQYTVKVDNNGYVSGFGLASTPVNGTPYSTFAVAADRFVIASPQTGQTTPFQVIASPTYIDGVYVPAGVYMTQGFIRNAIVDTLHIANNAISVLVNATGSGSQVSTSINVPSGETWKVMVIGFCASSPEFISGQNTLNGPINPGNAFFAVTGTTGDLMPVQTRWAVGASAGDYRDYYWRYQSGSISGALILGAGTHTLSVYGPNGAAKAIMAIGNRK